MGEHAEKAKGPATNGRDSDRKLHSKVTDPGHFHASPLTRSFLSIPGVMRQEDGPQSKPQVSPLTRHFLSAAGHPDFVQRALYDEKEDIPNDMVMAKLEVNEPGDRFEQEADRVADQVVQRVAAPPAVQQQTEGDNLQRELYDEKEDIPNDMVMAKRESAVGTPLDPPPAEGGGNWGGFSNRLNAMAFRKAEGGNGPQTAGQGFSSKLSATKGGGSPLSPGVQQEMAAGFGRPMDHVRVHTDSSADALSRSINAKAFTHEGDIYFKSGQYDPGSAQGKRLLAHELQHTLQQGAGDVIRRWPDDPEPHWQSLTPYELVKELGYDWAEVKSQFKEVNGALLGTDDNGYSFNTWIKVSIIKGWRMGQEPYYYGDVDVTYDLERNKFVIEAWSYDDAVTKARSLGLLETDTFYWKRKLSGTEEYHGLRKADPIDWWNHQNVELTTIMLQMLGAIAEDMPLAGYVATIEVNPTLNPAFSALVRKAQTAMYSDDPDKITGKMDDQTYKDLRMEYEPYLQQKQYELERNFVPEPSGKKFAHQDAFEKYLKEIQEEMWPKQLDEMHDLGFTSTGSTYQLYVDSKRSEWATMLFALSDADRKLYGALLTYQQLKIEKEQAEAFDEPLRDDYETTLNQTIKDIETYSAIRYKELNELIAEQQAIIADEDSDYDDKKEAQKQLSYYQKLREPLIDPNPEKIIEDFKDANQEVLNEDETYQSVLQFLPPTVDPKTAYGVYYITLVKEMIDLGYKYGYLTKEGYDDTSTGEKISAMLRSTFVGLPEDEARYLQLHFTIYNTMGSFIFNENPLATHPYSSTGDVFLQALGTSYMGELGQELFATDQTVAQMILGNLSDTGLSMEDLTDDASDTISQTAEGYEAFSAKDWAQMLGMSVGILTQMVGVGGAFKLIGKGLQMGRLGVLLGRLSTMGKNVLNMSRAARVLATSRITRWLYAGLKSGVLYEVTGDVFKNSAEEANFWAGFLGGLGGDLAKGLFFKIFGKFSSKAVAKIVEINGKAGGEVAEETIQALLDLHQQAGSFDEMMGMIGDMFEAPEGGYSPAFKLFVQSYTMGLAFGSGSSLSVGFMNYSQNQISTLNQEEKALAEEYASQLNETYILSLEVALESDADIDATGQAYQYTVTAPVSGPSYTTTTTPAGVNQDNLQQTIVYYQNLVQMGVGSVSMGNSYVPTQLALSLLENGDLVGFQSLFEENSALSEAFRQELATEGSELNSILQEGSETQRTRIYSWAKQKVVERAVYLRNQSIQNGDFEGHNTDSVDEIADIDAALESLSVSDVSRMTELFSQNTRIPISQQFNLAIQFYGESLTGFDFAGPDGSMLTDVLNGVADGFDLNSSRSVVPGKQSLERDALLLQKWNEGWRPQSETQVDDAIYQAMLNMDLELTQEDIYLPQNVEQTFYHDLYYTVTSPTPLFTYRLFGGKSALGGGFATSGGMTNSQTSTQESALLPEWGNSMEFEARIEIPANTPFHLGKAAPQASTGTGDFLPGGGDQVILPYGWSQMQSSNGKSWKVWIRSIVNGQPSGEFVRISDSDFALLRDTSDLLAKEQSKPEPDMELVSQYEATINSIVSRSEQKQAQLNQSIDDAIHNPNPDKSAKQQAEDQMEGEVASWVQSHVIEFGKKVPPDTGEFGEIDIELDEWIIEVTSQKRGKKKQINKYVNNVDGLNPEGKKVVLYAPNYNTNPGKDIVNLGAFVARSKAELLTILGLQ